jgi:mannose-1-phosphate guanylyltransferase/phosphomannomutase
MKVVVLNGGKGSRLGLKDRPKPMAKIAGKPLLERILEIARISGFRDFLFLNGYLAEVIEEHFGDGGCFGVQIQHVREQAPLGTAGAVRAARSLLPEPFLLLYGDILIDVDLKHFAAAHSQSGSVATLFVHPNDHPRDSDLIEVDGEGRIRRFIVKPHPANVLLPNLVSAALYAVNPTAIDYVPPNGPSDWAHDVFPRILAAGLPLSAYRSLEYAKDVGTPERLLLAEADFLSDRVSRMSRRQAKPAVFFDRDGVLNREINGVHRPEDLLLFPDVGAMIQRVNRAGVPAICITNQPDVAKGLVSLEMLTQIFAALDTALAVEGAYLDDVYYCPHHPEGGWIGEVEALKIACACRKPEPGMFRAAAQEHFLDLSRSWMIGDRYVDIEAAHAAGAKAVLLRRDRQESCTGTERAIADFTATSLSEAVSIVLDNIT